MGLTAHSMGSQAADTQLILDKNKGKIIALVGNPNVGKSTIFNALTGLNQHTGNWPGKTVTNAQGKHQHQGITYQLIDLPGTYSLMAHSVEEEVARDFICFGGADALIVICDATCLERNLNLVLQAIEITTKVVVCVNLLDEAQKKKIHLDLPALSQLLGVPVIGTQARNNQGLFQLMDAVAHITQEQQTPFTLHYDEPLEKVIQFIQPTLESILSGKLNSRWVALKLIDNDPILTQNISQYLGFDLLANDQLKSCLSQASQLLTDFQLNKEQINDQIVSRLITISEQICTTTISYENAHHHATDRLLDKWLTSKSTGIPIMLALLSLIFWLTITGANLPSQLLSTLLFWFQDQLTLFFLWLGTPPWVHGILVLGMYRVVAWVIAVMLPPMAIFFPLFTLLEDFGYLPRVAFNLDHHFKKACACGKQSLSMCMGFGCNAAGIVGCRIIDSPRERLIAILTNNFVPCNGRFPTLIALITMFFVGVGATFWQSAQSALLLTAVVVLGIMMTFAVSMGLSKTILKGIPSSFTLELPPYRRPQVGKVIIRSIFDRTLFVLGRAMMVAAPVGMIIWLMANIQINGVSLLAHAAQFLDPFAYYLGLDGVILLAFILGFPANEIVLPIIIMTYLSTGTLVQIDQLAQLKTLLVDNGWTWVTAVSTMLFCLMHWPCSTTCLTIKKETQSLKWTILAFLLPTLIGMSICFLFSTTVRLFYG